MAQPDRLEGAGFSQVPTGRVGTHDPRPQGTATCSRRRKSPGGGKFLDNIEATQLEPVTAPTGREGILAGLPCFEVPEVGSIETPPTEANRQGMGPSIINSEVGVPGGL
jgi:hypothetical protein